MKEDFRKIVENVEEYIQTQIKKVDKLIIEAFNKVKDFNFSEKTQLNFDKLGIDNITIILSAKNFPEISDLCESDWVNIGSNGGQINIYRSDGLWKINSSQYEEGFRRHIIDDLGYYNPFHINNFSEEETFKVSQIFETFEEDLRVLKAINNLSYNRLKKVYEY